MDGLFLQILIAGTVCLVVVGLTKVLGFGPGGEKRKIAERLTGDGKAQTTTNAARTITFQADVTGLPGFLVRWSFIKSLHRKLAAAYPDATIARFLTIDAICGVSVFALVLLISTSPLAAAIGGGLGAYVPFFVLSSKRSRRQRQLADQLPEALDFLARILKAGHSLSTGIQMMSEELPKPLSEEFRRCYDQHSLGQSLEDGLKDMAGRVESTDFAFFVTAVLIQRQTGGDLSEVLTNISGMIRQRMRLQQHVKAKTAEGRFTSYVMVAFPVIMFVIAYMMNPADSSAMLRNPTGIKMLVTAGVLQIGGLIAIRRITNVKI